MNKYYKQLIGKTVKDVSKDDDIYCLTFTDNTVAWILCDPEGNGPGFLDIVLQEKV